jgi:hypothetical protein
MKIQIYVNTGTGTEVDKTTWMAKIVEVVSHERRYVM